MWNVGRTPSECRNWRIEVSSLLRKRAICRSLKPSRFMYFISTALYPLWKLEESGATWVWRAAQVNPFTHAVEWLRFAWYGKDPGLAPWVVLGTLAVAFVFACWGYDPQRGFGQLAKRGGGAAG